MEKWEQAGRDDLNMIPQMIDTGWKPRFSVKDVRYGRVTPEYVPLDAVSFIKGNILAVKFYRVFSQGHEPYWAVGDLVDSIYTNRREYDTLEEVIHCE